MSQQVAYRPFIQGIVPPHIHDAIIAKGSPAQREVARRTLAADATMRMSRINFQIQAAQVQRAQALPAITLGVKHRTIYTASNEDTWPGDVVRVEGQGDTKDPAVDEAYTGLGDTFDFYWRVFERNSIDDQGMHLNATVHFRQRYDNAFWNGEQMIFGDGDDDLFNRFTIALEVIGHELTHGVTGSEVNLIYQGQSGALNESISDVFGSLVKQYKLKQTADQADWLIGAGLFTNKVNGQALRSMKDPGTAYDDPLLGKDPQPAHMAAYVRTTDDNHGVHINSGIPNRAFYLLATRLGGYAWEKAGRIWYESVCDQNLKANATFKQFAKVTAVNAARFFGSEGRQATISAWKEVGVEVGIPELAPA